MSDDVVIIDDKPETEELPLLTFNAIYNILREEKKTKGLQKYPNLFYEAMEKFISDKKQTIKNEENPERRKKEQNILNNAKKIANEIVTIRSQKIARIATSNAFSEESIIDEENILQKEKDIYNAITKEIKKLTKNI